MKYIYNFLVLSLALASNTVMAQEVSVDVAKNRALEFLSNQTVGSKRAKGTKSLDVTLAYTSKSADKTCFYVFNAGEDDGFVIIGGDEAAREILGYCDHGSFDYDNAPDNFKWWLSQYTEQIAHAEKAGVTGARRAKAATNRANINPLISVKWSQEEPYNSKIVGISANNQESTGFVTGCVATAMAQVMKFWECPTQGQGSYSYEKNGLTFSANFGNTTYDWGNMLQTYNGNETGATADAVGTLMFHAGVSVDMDYGVNGSSANSYIIGNALATYFGYDKSVRNEFRDYYSDEAWEDLVYDELKAGRPVLYSGQAENGGHEFICDGYNKSYEMFTFNWGWNGGCDGCYPLTGTYALKPNGNGIGGAGEGSAYTGDQLITINVMPNQGGSDVVHLVQHDQSDLGCDNHMYLQVGSNTYDTNYDYTLSTNSQDFYLYSTYRNVSCIATKFEIGVKAFEKTTGICYYWKSDSDELANGSFWYDPQRFVFYPNELTYNGVYELRPVCRVEGGTDADWTEIDILTFETYPTLTVSGAMNPEPVDITFSIDENTVGVARTLQITHNSNYTGAITYSSSNPNVATVDENGLITGVSLGSATITVHGQAEGFYNETTTTFDITVTALVKEDVTFTISGTSVKQNKTLQISWTEDYDGTPQFSSSDASIATVDESGVVTGISDGTVTITATAPATTFFNEAVQQFTVTVVSGGIVMVEEPYFNNDNNVYEDDLVLHFKIMNATAEATDIKIHYLLEVFVPESSTTYSLTYNYSCSSNPDEVISGTLDLSIWPIAYKQIHFTPNAEYTIKLYKGEEETEDNEYEYPSVTFTYRNKLNISDYQVCPAGYGTLILPFNAEVPDDMTVYLCTDVDENGVLTLVEDESIRRNVPYIVKATPDKDYSFVGPEAIDYDDEDKQSFRVGIMVGAVTKNVLLAANDDYILQYHDQDDEAAFYKYTGTPSSDGENDSEGNRLAKQFRAFLRPNVTTGAPSYALPGDTEEGIEFIHVDTFMPAGIYSIDGKRQNEFKKGMNVIILEDGTVQKVYVK